MHPAISAVAAAAALVSMTISAQASGGVDAAWVNATVSIPQHVTASGKFCRGRASARQIAACIADVKPSARTPAIIFMHGCDGMNKDFVAALGNTGLPVFAPDSFAAGGRKQDCRVGADKKSILRLRLKEAAYAVKQAAALEWVDENRIILAGFSEGGVTAALYEHGGVKAKMIFGWSCNSLDPWWRGVRGPASVPVLAVVGAQDEYHQNRSNRGDCGKFIAERKNSRSVVIPRAPHNIVRYEETRAAIANFVRALW